jgi:hypothetical protein
MKSFSYKVLFFLFIVSGLLSCVGDLNNKDVEKGLGMVFKNGTGKLDFIVRLDNGTVLIPTALDDIYTPKDSDRVYVAFIPSGGASLDDTVSVTLDEVSGVMYEPVKTLNDKAEEDSLNAEEVAVGPGEIWVAYNILNVVPQFENNNTTYHDFNLAFPHDFQYSGDTVKLNLLYKSKKFGTSVTSVKTVISFDLLSIYNELNIIGDAVTLIVSVKKPHPTSPLKSWSGVLYKNNPLPAEGKDDVAFIDDNRVHFEE